MTDTDDVPASDTIGRKLTPSENSGEGDVESKSERGERRNCWKRWHGRPMDMPKGDGGEGKSPMNFHHGPKRGHRRRTKSCGRVLNEGKSESVHKLNKERRQSVMQEKNGNPNDLIKEKTGE
uniref:Uncharacterized protein n=1 Tax=Plectus sambesii TaxID=2011161 RepID=A0A914V0K0_9BILA